MYKSVLLILVCFSFYPAHVAAQGGKHALIIAVGDYQPETGWKAISSKNDVLLIQSALIAQGFEESKITVILDEKATKNGIITAFENLLNTVQKGDAVVVHYSGHGQQITDDNGDEIDGYDEAMVPYDAFAHFKKGVYEGENHIRDDKIGEILTALRQKVGPDGSVMLIMDSCHSGTASRGLAKTRGTQEVFDTGESSTPNPDANESGQFGLEGPVDDGERAPLICFYGASAHELNYETTDAKGNGVGSLSYAFSDAFANASATQSYAELFDQIKNRMSVLAPRQTPQAEGDLQNGILGGAITGKKNYFTVSNVINGKIITIHGGSLMGVYEQSEITFYPLGKEETPENAIATGTVTFVDATTADVELPEMIADFPDAKAVITKANYGSISVSVQMSGLSPELENALTKHFEAYPLIAITDESADLILEENNEYTGGGQAQLITNQEYALYQTNYTDVDLAAQKFTERILAYAQANYLRQVEMMDEDLAVYFEFIPVKAKQVGRGRWIEDSRLPLAEKQDESGNVSFNEGDFFKLKVVNDGYEVAYFSILDFQPDNYINVLIPGKYEKAADFVIKPGEERELPRIYRIGPPGGTEVFKLVASSEPIAFRSILKNQGAQRGANDSNNPFAKLVSGSFRNKNTRGTETMSVSPGNCNIHSVTFTIIEK